MIILDYFYCRNPYAGLPGATGRQRRKSNDLALEFTMKSLLNFFEFAW
jgi:hypothetical protein